METLRTLGQKTEQKGAKMELGTKQLIDLGIYIRLSLSGSVFKHEKLFPMLLMSQKNHYISRSSFWDQRCLFTKNHYTSKRETETRKLTHKQEQKQKPFAML